MTRDEAIKTCLVLVDAYIEEAKRPDNSFDLRDVERLLAAGFADPDMAALLVREWARAHAIQPTTAELASP